MKQSTRDEFGPITTTEKLLAEILETLRDDPIRRRYKTASFWLAVVRTVANLTAVALIAWRVL